MIEIKIRREWQANAAHLAEVYDVSDIDAVLRSLQVWGLADDDATEMIGQWVLTDTERPDAYFEFVICDVES